MTTAFISYSWDSDEHKDWVRSLAARLRENGIDVQLDQWHLVPGDQLPEFMESAVRNSEFVLVVCTPRYKARSDDRTGGVGYEGDIMSAEVFSSRNQRKFIPILRMGTWKEAAASWLVGKYYVDLGANPYSEAQFTDLLTTLHRTRPAAPPVKPPPVPSPAGNATNAASTTAAFEPLRIRGVVVDEVSAPRDDGTPGSALYAVPFQLSARPPSEWANLFVASWKNPPRCTSMHRPWIASVRGDRVILDGTTIPEVERYHRETLILALNEANEQYTELEEKRRRAQEAERRRVEEHKKQVQEAAGRLKFDE